MSDYTVVQITIPGLPKTPNIRQHWAAKAAHNKKWRKMAGEAAWAEWKKYPQCGKPLQRVRLTLIRGSTKEPDLDNLVASFKSIIDGLKDAGIISDDNPRVVSEIKPRWEKAPRKAGYVKVIVEEL